MGTSRASKNILYRAMGKLKYASDKVKTGVKNKIAKENKIHELWKQDYQNGTGQYYDSRGTVMKRHGMK